MNAQTGQGVGAPPALSIEQLNFRRALGVADRWKTRDGLLVRNGPMRGLDFLPQASEGCYLPKLIGVYEQPLHPHIEAAIVRGYGRILNIGCAEGYYAVGLARRMATTRVEAFDINPRAADFCRDLAQRNGVADRVTPRGPFTSFEDYRGERPLVICDIEGAELELLNPEASPALREMDLIVESHECYRPGITRALASRFEASHRVTLVTDDGLRTAEWLPDWFKALPHLDQLLAVWECRSGPTPWLVMRASG